MSQKPLVSIGLFTFNGAGTLRRAVDALLAQSYKNFEFIISDNASTDETPDILREYATRDQRINYLRQKETVSAADNQQFVLNRARGKYFMWAADDDWWDPKFIEMLVGGLEENPEHGVAMSSYDLLWPDGTLKNRVVFSGEFDLTRQNHKEVFKKMLFDAPIHVFIYGLFRRNFLLKLMRRSFPRSARHDRVLMCEAALAAHFYTVEPVLFFKVRADSPLSSRETYTGDPMARAAANPLAMTNYFLTLPLWLLTSSLIPLSRKRHVIFNWPRVFWLRKKRIFDEFVGLLKRFLPSFFPKNFSCRQKLKEFICDAKYLGGNWFSRSGKFLLLLAGAKVTGQLDFPEEPIKMRVKGWIELGRLRACHKEPETVSWIESFVKSGDVFYDIGANVGAYSFVACAVAGKKCRVYAFEPGAPTFAALEKNIALNHASNSITPYQVAITEKTDLFTFHYRSKKPGDASHVLTEEGELPDEKFQAAAREKIKGYALDDFIATFRIDPPTHMKIDVDGSEPAVVKGAVKTLKFPGLRSILIEIDEKRDDAGEIMTVLENAGLALHSKHQRGSAGKRVFNYIFVKKA